MLLPLKKITSNNVVFDGQFNPSRPNPGRREKIKLNFIFTLLCGTSKGFMKALKTFIKLFEAPQRIVKIKFNLIFIFNTTFRNARDVKC